jgi:DivIVA domain-containing protein
MTDTSDPYAPRASRTTPEAIAERTFSQVKRGYAESEVRAYLRMVSSDFAAAAARERDLAARVRDLEEQSHKPVLPPSDQDLIAALGEETARVLGQARESAIELKNKAEEHARRVVREAQETARELRTTTQQAVETKTREAEDAARARAKEIVGEARTLRERVLADLESRREDLERQITELRENRGKLVETYELVERALGHAARVMADEPSAAPEVPALAPVDEPSTAPVAPVVTITAPAAAPTTSGARKDAADDAATGSSNEPANEPVKEAAQDSAKETAAQTAKADAGGAAEDAKERATSEPQRDVGALFEKLRSGAGDEKPDDKPADDAHVEPEGAPTRTSEGAPAGATLGDDDLTEAVAVVPAEAHEPGEPAGSAGDATGGEDDDAGDDAEEEGDPATRARDTALAGTADDLVRRGKRALQDEQNDLLDGLRRQRGKIDVGKVLPTSEDQVARWAHVLQPAVDAAYSAGAGSVEGAKPIGAAPRGLLTELSTSLVTPLRERLGSSLDQIDARTPADTEIAVAQSLGARYREWRGEPLESALGEVLAVAWSRGVFDAAADGARLRWIPAVVGKCPDCDDNALEPTVKGSDFPTGQPHPPAHPGCRCLLVVDAG